ncbi:MAG: carboxypeptidase regulatory-like domain-containing protein [Gemmataceae bacterium]|nr:carboxypeptidase regulatory-like domain-containing protein [Gemmataceae bacterium]
MRSCHTLLLLCLLAPSIALAQENKSSLDKQISEALRDVHDRGADLYNGGEIAGGYRIYQGGLVVAKGLLGHRPEVQKLISTGLAKADREETVARKAFVLHELIEQVRVELRITVEKGPEKLAVPPREVKPELKPMASVGEITTGVLGRVLWQGMPVGGAEVLYVSHGRLPPKVYETTTGTQGVYVIADLEPGKYIVIIFPGPMSTVKKLPERYATTTNSPLVFDVKAKGEKLDFLLQ